MATEPLPIPPRKRNSTTNTATKEQRLSSSFSDVCMEEFTPPDDTACFDIQSASSPLLPLPGEQVLQCIVRTRYVVFANAVGNSDESVIEDADISSPRNGLSGHRIDHSDAFLHPKGVPSVAGSSLTRGLFRASTQVGNGFLKGASGLVQSTYAGGASGSLFGLAKGLGSGII